MNAAAYVWAKVVSYLEKQLTEVMVSTWLDDAEVIELTEDRLVLYSSSDFRREVIRGQFAPYIQEALKELFGSNAKLVVWGESERKASREKKNEHSVLACNPQFTFENFVPGNNQIAVKIAREVASHPGQDKHNPLFLYGPPGVGKTHLLYAIANQLLRDNPEMRVVYIRGDQFTNELVSAVQQGKMAEFKKKYYRAQVLLVDDIHFIAGKEATQEAFFQTFDELYGYKRQIIMTADRPPVEMATLEDRLRSRFGGGVLVGIAVPDYATRVTIIEEKAATLNLSLDEQTVAYLAENLTDNVRQIEGALKKICAFRELSGMELTLSNVSRTVEDIRTGSPKVVITPNLVIDKVCRYYCVEEAALKGRQKSRGVAEPRQVAMYLLRTRLNMSFPAIGKEFSRDHSTAQTAVRTIETRLTQRDQKLQKIITDIVTDLEGI